jgi:hypothetical protein
MSNFSFKNFALKHFREPKKKVAVSPEQLFSWTKVTYDSCSLETNILFRKESMVHCSNIWLVTSTSLLNKCGEVSYLFDISLLTL